MTYPEQTSGRLHYNNYVYFAFSGDLFDTNKVTQEMGIEPTSVMIKKDPRPKTTAWYYKINAGSDIDLKTYLARLLDIVESKIDVINRLKKEFNLNTRLQFVVFIDFNPNISTPYFGLDKRAIDFLGKTGTETDFDLYKADTTEPI